jgi:hypothetical protein
LRGNLEALRRKPSPINKNFSIFDFRFWSVGSSGNLTGASNLSSFFPVLLNPLFAPDYESPNFGAKG